MRTPIENHTDPVSSPKSENTISSAQVPTAPSPPPISSRMPKSAAARRSPLLSSRYGRRSGGRTKISRTARRENVTQPIAVQINVTRAIAPVMPNRLAELVAISATASGVIGPSLSINPGTYWLMRSMRFWIACSLPPSQSPASAKAT